MDIDTQSYEDFKKAFKSSWLILLLGYIFTFIFLNPVIGLLLFLYGLTILSPGICGIIADPFKDLIFPIIRRTKPEISFSHIQAKVKKGQYEEALIMYEDLCYKFPNDIRPYIEMMNICTFYLKNIQRTELVYKKGIEKLKDEEKKKYLEKIFSDFLSSYNIELQNTQRKKISVKNRNFIPPKLPKHIRKQLNI